MSKSILVIDTPENCCGCDLESGHYCGKEKRYIGEEEFETIPDWCPLCDLPEKKVNIGFGAETRECGFINGFNYCIDEILEGGEAE